jgi:Mce-associated membrane protein
MPLRKRTSPVVNGDADNDPSDVDRATDPADAMALAEEAEAEAAEAEALANAARARARALKLRRQAEAAAKASGASGASAATGDVSGASAATGDVSAAAIVAVPADIVAGPTDVDETEATEAPLGETTDEPVIAEPVRRRRFALPRVRLTVVAAGLVIVCTLGLLGVSGYMIWAHQRVVAERQRSAEFAAAAEQGVVTLMSLDFNHAADDVKRIVDNSTGDFKKDFQNATEDFTKVAQDSKVITTAVVNAAAVQSMTRDTATVLVSATTHVSNAAGKDQPPRAWRLFVDVARDGGQIKLAKVEFVP